MNSKEIAHRGQAWLRLAGLLLVALAVLGLPAGAAAQNTPAQLEDGGVPYIAESPNGAFRVFITDMGGGQIDILVQELVNPTPTWQDIATQSADLTSGYHSGNALFYTASVSFSDTLEVHVGTNSSDLIQAAGFEAMLAFGLDGNDTIDCDTTQAVVFGGNDGDNIYGSHLDDVLYSGFRSIPYDPSAWGETDYVYGYEGDDTIIGDEGWDALYGGEGRDTIEGGGNDDYIEGGAGCDNIWGDYGHVLIAASWFTPGGDGDDEIWGDIGNDPWTDGHDDLIFGGDGDDLLYGQGGNDAIDGGNGDDYLHGGTGSNFLHDRDGTHGDYVVSGSGDGQNGGNVDNLIIVLDISDDTIELTAGSGNWVFRDTTNPPLDTITGTGSVTINTNNINNLPGGATWYVGANVQEAFEEYARNYFWNSADWLLSRTCV